MFFKKSPLGENLGKIFTYFPPKKPQKAKAPRVAHAILSQKIFSF